MSDAEASSLDLHLSISDGFGKTKIYDKREDFNFDIVIFFISRWLCSSFGILLCYISKLIDLLECPVM